MYAGFGDDMFELEQTTSNKQKIQTIGSEQNNNKWHCKQQKT